MALLPILTQEAAILRQKAKRVSRVDSSIRQLIDDMVEEAPPTRVIAESWGFPEAATIPRVLLISAIRSS